MKNLNKILFAVIVYLLVFFTFSCGTMNKSIHKSSTDSTSISKTDITINTHTQSEISSSSTKTITEIIDTLVNQKPDSVKAIFALKKLERGDTLISSDGNFRINAFFDKEKNSLIIKVLNKPDPVIIYINKKTEEKNDTRENVKIDDKKDIKQENKTEVKSEKKDKDVERDSCWNMFWTGFTCGVLLLIIIIIVYKYLKTYLRFLP